MNRILIIARQEFIKFVTRRGFLFTLIGVPLWIVLAAIVPALLSNQDNRTYFAVIDRNGGAVRQQIADSLARHDERADLEALSDFALQHADMSGMRKAAPQIAAMLSDPDKPSSLREFENLGGWHKVFFAISPYIKQGAPDFHAPEHSFVLVDTPADVANAPASRFADASARYLGGKLKARGNEDSVDLGAIVVIPKGYGTAPAEFWSEHKNTNLRDFLQTTLTKDLRLRAIQKLAGTGADIALDSEAPLERHDPSPPDRRGIAKIAADIGVPIGAAILLLIVSLMNSMALLQGVVEEKSTRMIEVLLSSATPWEIVGGKIAGVIAVALFTIVIWVLGAVVSATLLLGSNAGPVFHAIGTTLANPELVPFIVIYFLCGLLIYGAIFLSIGSMSASLADAQAYLGPSMMILMLPNIFLSGVLQAPNGTLATVTSYFPIYTPYIMLLRIGSHPPWFELATTAALSIALTVFLVWKAGDIFARHALTTERPPAIRSLFGRTLGRVAEAK